MEVLRRLVATADIVQHNMRMDAAERLGVGEPALRAIKGDLIYCHTRGFDRGERDGLPGNDQTGAALAGTSWLDGGLDDDGMPLWSVCSLGDTGNGLLSAIAMVQALYHRDRTGEGQFVDTSILYAQLINASLGWVGPDGHRHPDRPSSDRDLLGWSALYGLYETAEGWLCIAALDDSRWRTLCASLGVEGLADDPRYATAGARHDNDPSLRSNLATRFATRSAAEWFGVLDAAGVPCEVSDPDFCGRFFADESNQRRGWVATYEQGLVGRSTTGGMSFDLEGSPCRVQGPTPVVGQHTEELLIELGYSPDEIDTLVADNVALRS